MRWIILMAVWTPRESPIFSLFVRQLCVHVAAVARLCACQCVLEVILVVLESFIPVELHLQTILPVDESACGAVATAQERSAFIGKINSGKSALSGNLHV